MTAVLGAVIGLLLLGLVMQHRRSRHHSRQFTYIHDKLDQIISQSTQERLLMFSSSPELQTLLTDVNRLLDINHEGIARRNKLQKSMRQMLANVSHDLKTPLTVVLGYIETLLQDGEMDAEERERLLRMIHQKAGEVITLMNTFFDLAKLESGDHELSLSRVEAGEVCRRNILAFYDILSAKGMDVAIEIPDEACYIRANNEALDRILSNLLSNAIRYGAAGGVVGLKLDSGTDTVNIEIWDRGKGISEDHQDKVFERLYTLEDSRNRVYQGSGLGLTITKRLTEQMNGKISLVSQPCVRTAFTVSFPRINL
ncbi:Signal transduction histidine kinase [Paenibacillus sophorae]|uniref:histidine kinase n=1 Tax=Paenibacillus sophorae TaxID=1333845 RepID=A0A1H8TM28_9BACL|nr:sensor histidine kinase [Paenibacillus sophorae]QWU16285.1 sensor histidine kinase [Paenibacillus sophorae]SEO91905.1 Signal transduction histidine kinase [Paenibacillus sophorae]